MKKFVFALMALLLLAIPVSAQSTGGAALPTPETTAMPEFLEIPGNDLACRHINDDDVEFGGFISTWGGADGAYSHVRMSFTAPTFPVAHDAIVLQKDVHGSNLPGEAIIVFAGDTIALGQFGGHIFMYVECRPDQLLEFVLEFFAPFKREHITQVILGLGLLPEDYLDRPGVLVLEEVALPTATPAANTRQQRDEAESALSKLVLADKD